MQLKSCTKSATRAYISLNTAKKNFDMELEDKFKKWLRAPNVTNAPHYLNIFQVTMNKKHRKYLPVQMMNEHRSCGLLHFHPEVPWASRHFHRSTWGTSHPYREELSVDWPINQERNKEVRDLLCRHWIFQPSSCPEMGISRSQMHIRTWECSFYDAVFIKITRWEIAYGSRLTAKLANHMPVTRSSYSNTRLNPIAMPEIWNYQTSPSDHQNFRSWEPVTSHVLAS